MSWADEISGRLAVGNIGVADAIRDTIEEAARRVRSQLTDFSSASDVYAAAAGRAIESMLTDESEGTAGDDPGPGVPH